MKSNQMLRHLKTEEELCKSQDLPVPLGQWGALRRRGFHLAWWCSAFSFTVAGLLRNVAASISAWTCLYRFFPLWALTSCCCYFCYVLALDTIILSFLKDFSFYYPGILPSGWYACCFCSGPAVNGHTSGAGEMTQGPRVFTPLAEDWTLGPSTHVDWLTAAFNYSFRRSDALFLPLWAPALVCTHVGISTHVHTIKNDKIKSTGLHGYFHVPDSCRVWRPRQCLPVGGSDKLQVRHYKSPCLDSYLSH